MMTSKNEERDTLFDLPQQPAEKRLLCTTKVKRRCLVCAMAAGNKVAFQFTRRTEEEDGEEVEKKNLTGGVRGKIVVVVG
jgi:hypothetical protein